MKTETQNQTIRNFTPSTAALTVLDSIASEELTMEEIVEENAKNFKLLAMTKGTLEATTALIIILANTQMLAAQLKLNNKEVSTK
jgi:hypothetical protein